MSFKHLALLGVAALSFFAPLAAAEDWSGECMGGVINLSFTPGGDTIYFNNHCDEAMTINYKEEDGSWSKAFEVSQNTKGSDSVWGDVYGVDAFQV
ncbi:hypothetical protein FQN54_006904 [Arachnomyces sp. PD_36]|nr:hypothetical protein FQN54_006904 [Arachnomyces sp. PD_36]